MHSFSFLLTLAPHATQVPHHVHMQLQVPNKGPPHAHGQLMKPHLGWVKEMMSFNEVLTYRYMA